jgi:hypothetical protein
MSTTGVHKSEKKEVRGEPAVQARARARDGSRSRWGALALAERAAASAPGYIAAVWKSCVGFLTHATFSFPILAPRSSS